MKKLSAVIIPSFLLACASAPEWTWQKPNSSETDFHNTQYICLQKSQQPFSTSSAINSGGLISPDSISSRSFSSGMMTNAALFEACMLSNGWKKQSLQSSETSQITSRSNSSEAVKSSNCAAEANAIAKNEKVNYFSVHRDAYIACLTR